MSSDAKTRLGKHDIKVTTAGDKIKMTLPNKILFSSGSAALRSDSKKPLDEAAKVIKHEFANSELIIQGHTDNQPIKHSANKWSSNDELSVARAKAVATALQKAGVKNRMKTEGLGESKPLNENRTPEERAANRRVEILIGTHGAAREKAPAAPASGMEEDLGS
jgi:flagellar motor protein MotB